MLKQLKHDWPRLIERAERQQHTALAAAMAAAKPKSIDANHLTLSLPADDPHRAALRGQTELHESLVGLLQSHSGRRFRIDIALRDDHRQDPETKRLSEVDLTGDRNRAYREAQTHPTVQRLSTMFDAEIISREPATYTDWDPGKALGIEPTTEDG